MFYVFYAVYVAIDIYITVFHLTVGRSFCFGDFVLPGLGYRTVFFAI